MSVRVRFAPSPTGYLHIGGVRTALFNWLFARHEGGTFVLRIEDTDRERSTDESIQQILEGMEWIGLDWDEGPQLQGSDKGDSGPYRQTQRQPIYQKYIDQLLDSGHLYRCYCTKEEIDQQRQEAQSQKKRFRYDGRCRDKGLIEGKPFALRIQMPDDQEFVVQDKIRGEVRFQTKELDDWICVRTDGTPTYNFCVVIDDFTMGITHVIRGDDHLNNTPKQLSVFHALKAPLPVFAHIPMILGQDRKGKLSKREGASSILDFKELGFLPEASVNYLARLCWSYGDQEIFSQKELIEKFTLEGINKSSAAFDLNKLTWVNTEHLKGLSPEEILERAKPYFDKAGRNMNDTSWMIKIIELYRERAKTLQEFVDQTPYLFNEPELDLKAAKKFLKPEIAPALGEALQGLKDSQDWSEEGLKPLFQSILEKHQIKMMPLAQAIRVSITGSNVSPSIFEVLQLLGREKSIERIEHRLKELQAQT